MRSIGRCSISILVCTDSCEMMCRRYCSSDCSLKRGDVRLTRILREMDLLLGRHLIRNFRGRAVVFVWACRDDHDGIRSALPNVGGTSTSEGKHVFSWFSWYLTWFPRGACMRPESSESSAISRYVFKGAQSVLPKKPQFGI